ncbi:disulfide isomerase [Jimgerdemannia flammicorona]|uniref:protein disulfide-isomerase n=1 Tax=Jimgerdemannia flammicorona TaxID=994334 RepID=A0A433DN22_9FUNG|nr:disulfide isomerase [Jimgerdemannia flammicorona]
MLAKSLFLAVVATLIALGRAKEDNIIAPVDSDVIILTKNTFEAVMRPEELIMIEFYTPWYGHSKALAPEYESAATTLKEDNLKLAKVDCDAEKDLCQEHGIDEYPTIKIFKSGRPTNYGGTQKADDLVNYMRRHSLPALSEVTDVEAFRAAADIAVLAFLSESDKAWYDIFHNVASDLRDDYLFGVATSEELAQEYNASHPSVLLFKMFDDDIIRYDGDFLEDDLSLFVHMNAVPVFGEIDTANFASYAEAGLPLAYLFVDDEEERDRLVEELKPIAREYKERIYFVYINASVYGEYALTLNLMAEWPAFGIQQPENGAKFPYDQSKNITVEGVKEFVAMYMAGEIAPSVKSQPVPEKNDNPVKVLVYHNFDEIVYDTEKDVFVEFYAPWCSRCKELAPTWDNLATKLHANPANANIMIAKIDLTANDLPLRLPFRVQGLPTFKLFKAGEKEIIDFDDGEHSLAALVEFLEENAVNTPVLPREAGFVVQPHQVVVKVGEKVVELEEGGWHDEL